ncbi:hypothetical protein BJY52DRAFT_834312 [Lactarius psammicola]|nr:hypothetical protein BJY52DRAFT_834312 [Lactarius psammicola]
MTPFAPLMANYREYQRQSIDAKIEASDESIRALRLRRNALAPISSLPPEVFATIFSFVRLPDRSILAEEPDHLACLRVAHVCHQWREIALNQPLLWSHVDFTTLTLVGAAEMLARAKMVPLHVEARVPIGRWDDSRFSAFKNDLQTHVSHICHLGINLEYSHLHKTLEGLVSPAPTLEYLSLSSEARRDVLIQPRVFVPDNIFDGTTPRLSCLELGNCDISWGSPLLKGLKHLEIRTPSASRRPSLSVWLDVLDEMPQLKTLSLHSATPVVPPGASLPFDIKRTVTLPSLVHLDISASARDCGLALAHLVLPALTWLCALARSSRWNGSDVREILPYVSQHAHGPQDTRPLQSMVVTSEKERTHILAWSQPDVDIELRSHFALFFATRSARVAFTIINEDWFSGIKTRVFDAAMAALPLDSLKTLTAQNHTMLLDKQIWLRHAPRWPLLQRVRLAPPAARGFREMLLEDNEGSESPLLPSLTNLVLVESALSARRTLCLCDALVKRVEQGVPLETLDLRTCSATSRAVQLLSEIVVDVRGPDETPEAGAQRFSSWDPGARGLFVPDDDSGVEDYDEDDDDLDDDEEREHWGINYEEEEVEDDWEIEED